ncbi:MAG: hypothetical protein ACI815_001752 [Psychroserpens sp.]
MKKNKKIGSIATMVFFVKPTPRPIPKYHGRKNQVPVIKPDDTKNNGFANAIGFYTLYFRPSKKSTRKTTILPYYFNLISYI